MVLVVVVVVVVVMVVVVAIAWVRSPLPPGLANAMSSYRPCILIVTVSFTLYTAFDDVLTPLSSFLHLFFFVFSRSRSYFVTILI